MLITKLEGKIIKSNNAKIASDIKIQEGASVNGGLVNNGILYQEALVLMRIVSLILLLIILVKVTSL